MAGKKKIHYAWFILAGCCALQGGALGILINSGGVFFSPVAADLGVGIGEISLYFTIFSLCMTITLPLVGKLLPKLNIRILLTAAYSLCALSIGAMSFYTAVWQWYVSGAVLGLAGAFVFLVPAPVLIGNWFHKKSGLAMGIAMAFSGVGGAIMGPVLSGLIESIGWREAYLAMAAISAAIVLPFTIFVIRFKPADIGLTPYGYEESANGESANGENLGVDSKTAMKSLAFMAMFFVFGIIAFNSGFSQQLPSFAASLNLPAAIGATMLSLSMIGNMGGKLGLGALNDKLGIKKVFTIGIGIVATAFALLLFSNGNSVIMFVGSCLYGVSMALQSVLLPLLVRAAFGSKDFSAIFSNLNMGASLIGAFSVSIIGFVYDFTGSYTSTFALGLALCGIALFLAYLALSSSKKLSWGTDDPGLKRGA